MFDNATVQLILLDIAAKGVGAVLISLAVSAGFTAYYCLAIAPPFNLLTFGGYALLVWATANGIFKATHTPTA